jgi:uncharacterized membrane protein YtjA (UPF0391 family)
MPSPIASRAGGSQQGTNRNALAFSVPHIAAYGPQSGNKREADTMLGWAVTFLIVALIAALLGFGGIAGVAVEAAKIVFFVAIILFAISAIVGLVRGRSPTVP